MKTHCGIYKITNMVNNKFYIGSSKHIEKRWKEHISSLNKNRHSNMFLQKDWNKYKEESFKFEILELTTEDDRFDIETKYLSDLKPFHYNGIGYNINENATMKNPSNLRIFRKTFYKINPFYGLSDAKIKKMLRNDNYTEQEGYDELQYKNINSKSKYIWYYLDGSYAIAKLTGSIPRIIDNDYLDSHNREEILEYCEALDAYDDLVDLMGEYSDGNFSDEWE